MILFQTSCFAHFAKGARILLSLSDLNAEAVRLAATIKRNFEELWV